MPLSFELLGECIYSKARVSKMYLKHAVVETPVFMPVGTQGTMKGVCVSQLQELKCNILLGNTYHLALRPGEKLFEENGGLHNFMGWPKAILTDSGGFQMVSLLKLTQVSEEGVKFISPRDGSEMLLSPERSIEIQNCIGADIIMQLDDVVSSLTTGPRVEEAMERSIRWLDRCVKAHKREDCQNLFPIIQGGTDLNMRSKCIKEMVSRNLPGYAIGGLSGGEDKELFWKTVHHCTSLLPRNKPIYCMGVGYAVDLVVCTALGVDMFDCVYPTRTARFGTALSRKGLIYLRKSQYSSDFSPLDENCNCSTCKNFSRAYLHSIVTKETVACHLITIHNINFQLRLMQSIRESILSGTFPQFVVSFLKNWFSTDDLKSIPSWINDSLNASGINLERFW